MRSILVKQSYYSRIFDWWPAKMAPLSHFLPITLTQNTKGWFQQSSTMLSAPELKAKIANTKAAVHCSKHSELVCFRDLLSPTSGPAPP